MLCFLLINVKFPTIVGILTLMSRIKIMLSSAEHEKVLKPRGLIVLVHDKSSLDYSHKLLVHDHCLSFYLRGEDT